MNKYKNSFRIIKPFCFYSSTWNGKSACRGTAAIIIDLISEIIDIELFTGPAPCVQDILLFLLSDRNIRKMIQRYQEKDEREIYAIRATTGDSGRKDYYINFYNKYGLQTHGKKLLHISQFDKLNEGWIKMTIDDFVELIAYLKKQSEFNCDLNDPQKLKRLSKCHYIKGYFCDDTASNTISQII